MENIEKKVVFGIKDTIETIMGCTLVGVGAALITHGKLIEVREEVGYFALASGIYALYDTLSDLYKNR